MLPPIDLPLWVKEHDDKLKPPVNNYLLQRGDDFIVMAVGGPNERKDYHINPTEEWFFQFKGDMLLKIVDNGEFKEIVINIPHNPIRFADTVGIVIERNRPEGLNDKMRWYCNNCKAVVYEEEFYCVDLGVQLKPVIEKVRDNEILRSCHVLGKFAMQRNKLSFREYFQPIEKLGYKYVKGLGKGAYGFVCSAIDPNGVSVAIKRIAKLDSLLIAKRTLRELILLKHFKDCPNVIGIETILDTNSDLSEIFIVQKLMEADLHHIIQSKQELSDIHYQYFIYQILKGLFAIHQSNVLHRDLKPGNLLVNSSCDLKICDFGLSRKVEETEEENLTNYVATRWYRAPELMLSGRNYFKSVDLWSVGCILGELLNGRALFPGSNYVDQLSLILQALGTPSMSVVDKICSEKSKRYISSMPIYKKQPFKKMFPKGTDKALDLLEKLLEYDPEKRITAEEALKHPYLANYFEEDDLNVPTSEVDFSFESENDTVSAVKERLRDEIESYKALDMSKLQIHE